MLERVSIADPLSFGKRYPHELSGGMCQRAMIVMALICNPELIIADEPTTGLDVTIQRQIMDLLQDMRSQANATQILITHDLGLVAESCDRVVVMYAGRVVEVAPTDTLYSQPAHPYTRGLLNSIPRPDMDREPTPMPGYVPNAANRPRGCAFHPRCPQAMELCHAQEPPTVDLDPTHSAACHLLRVVA
jgi:oligopeptide/dipeptide ABC transporter ATP-binding protein